MDWDRFAGEHLDVAHEVVTRLRPAAERVAEGMAECLRGGGRILLCGNGGSAADAQHFAAELVNRFRLERKPWAAVALTTDSSVLTSIANDYSYEEVFSKQVEALGREGDWLVAISTSGNAANVLRAVEAAKAAGMKTLAMCGGTGGKLAGATGWRGVAPAMAAGRTPLAWAGGPGGKLAGAADEVLCVASSRTTARIQEGHEMLVHALCEMVEERLAGVRSQE